MLRVCWVLPDVGHYHHVRFDTYGRKACEAGTESFIIEIGGRSEFAEFKSNSISSNYTKLTLFPEIWSERISIRDIYIIWRTLDSISPEVVCVPGWGSRVALATLYWCLRAKIPAIVMCETQAQDLVRVSWQENVKRRIVGLFSAGMVGGTSHFNYLASLGMEDERIFYGYSVVDNGHFSSGARAARANIDDSKRILNLPDNYFIACCRLVPKKNLLGVLRAYCSYRKTNGLKAWKLLLLGDGPLMPDVLKITADMDLTDNVILPGFKGYDELPAYYGLARVLVLASTQEQWGLVVNEAMAAGLPVLVSERCGCAPDLVRNGKNGFTFDPYRVDELAALMSKVAGGDVDLDAMGRASREIISRWTPETFAENLWKAADAAVHAPRKTPRWTDKALLWALMRR